MTQSINDFLGGKVKIWQDKEGYRATSDSVLVAAAVHAKAGESVLDVGCGTGIILYCINARIPNLDLTGVEIQPDLYALAVKNAPLNACKPHFICESIDCERSSLHGLQFNHVVTNPPYYTEDFVRCHPQTAVAYHQIIDIEKWIRFCLKHLRSKGSFTMIHRAEALPLILKILQTSALGALEVIPIYSKEGESAKRVIIRGILGSKQPFQLHPGLVMHTETGQRSLTAESILRLGEKIP